MRKIIAGIVLAPLTILALGACTVPEDDGKTHAEDVIESADAAAKDDTKPAAEEAPEAPAEPETNYTTAQEQAIGSATDYLDFDAFSKSGLVEQLEFEDYSHADAVFAVNHIKVNWMKQAAASAKDYLDFDSFSRQGLIDQLTYEGYTQAQAEYGVTQAGL